MYKKSTPISRLMGFLRVRRTLGKLTGFVALLASFSVQAIAFEATSTESENQCAEYQLGETRYFSKDLLKGYLLDDKDMESYFVTRVGERHYEIAFDFRYLPKDLRYIDHPHLGRLTPPSERARIQATDERLRHQVQGCFEWFNKTYMLDTEPRITLALRDPSERDYRFWRTVKIAFNSNESHRSNSREYGIHNIPENSNGCAVIVHEALHIAGLSDEYIEQYEKTAERYFPMFNCRSTSDSIMAVDSMFATPHYYPSALRVCACPSGPKMNKCVEAANRTLSELYDSKSWTESCPEGMDELLSESTVNLLTDTSAARKLVRDLRDNSIIQNGVSYFYAVSFPAKPFRVIPPLFPGHIRKMLFPNCESRNRLFDSCIANAYRTTVDRGGDGCLAAPSICSETNAWLK